MTWTTTTHDLLQNMMYSKVKNFFLFDKFTVIFWKTDVWGNENICVVHTPAIHSFKTEEVLKNEVKKRDLFITFAFAFFKSETLCIMHNEVYEEKQNAYHPNPQINTQAPAEKNTMWAKTSKTWLFVFIVICSSETIFNTDLVSRELNG